MIEPHRKMLDEQVGKECEAVPSLLVNKASLLRVYVNSVNIWSWQALLYVRQGWKVSLSSFPITRLIGKDMHDEAEKCLRLAQK